MDYKTLEKEASSEIVINKSRFIGYATPVNTEEDALDFIKKIRKKHSDARHNVYAYIISENRMRYSDDGEPQGTAGMPLLNVLSSEKLFYSAIVVTRYFGGVLLGTGGLHRAYTESAKSAVCNAGMLTLTECVPFAVICEYGFYEKLVSIVKSHGGIIGEPVFEEKVSVKFSVPIGCSDETEKEIREASNNKMLIKRGKNVRIGLKN